jgi:hypothetical protein
MGDETQPDRDQADVEVLGSRATRTETTTRWFNADGKITGETVTTQVSYLADEKPDPGGYL